VDVLRAHVERFNAGVRGGDFSAMLDGLADDAELEFAGVPVGPFHGRAAIAEAYRVQPPDDEILILDERAEGETVIAGYAWAAHPGTRSGELRLTVSDGVIRRLLVTFA
jgi:steroid delta-isomerase